MTIINISLISQHIGKIMIKNLKILKSEILSSYTRGYIGKKTIKYYLNDGTYKICDQILKNKRNGDAVVIIPITTENKFVVILESRPLTKTGLIKEFPAGMIDENEKPLEAALRELREETGYIPKNIIPLEWHYQDQGCSKAIIYTFVAYDCEKKYNQELDREEKIDVEEMTYEEIMNEMNNLNTDNFKDANSKISIMNYTLLKRKQK